MRQLTRQDITNLPEGYLYNPVECFRIQERGEPELIFSGKANVLVKHYNNGDGTILDPAIPNCPKYDSALDILECGDMVYEDFLLRIYVS